jgi:hypothetical protein
MPGIAGMTAIVKNLGNAVKKPHASLDLPEKKHSGVRRDLAALKVSFDLFSLEVFKKKAFGGMMNFVQSSFLLHLVETYCKSIGYEGKQLFLCIIQASRFVFQQFSFDHRGLRSGSDLGHYPGRTVHRGLRLAGFWVAWGSLGKFLLRRAPICL